MMSKSVCVHVCVGVCLFVRLSVSENISETTRAIFNNFFECCLWPGVVAIRYLLPVLWMTSSFSIMGRIAV